MTAASPAEPSAIPVTPFDRIGGAAVVRRVTDHFYDLMEQDPAYARLRAMHADDLGPMRESLAGFLNAWLGGPRDWFADRPGTCIMSLHAQLAIDHEVTVQWLDAMRRAVGAEVSDGPLGDRMLDALGQMAHGMVRG